MPAARKPTDAEFYVYRLEVCGVPFYVGVGRSARASDRVRYVESLLKREKRGGSVNWSLSCAAVAGLLNNGCSVTVAYHTKGLTRSEALAAEKLEIARLAKAGTTLANVHHNPNRPKSAGDVIQSVLGRMSRKFRHGLPRSNTR